MPILMTMRELHCSRFTQPVYATGLVIETQGTHRHKSGFLYADRGTVHYRCFATSSGCVNGLVGREAVAQRTGRLTIHDIASLAGVSAGTVSRTLNNLPGVGQATRERILAIVSDHGFKIDSSARQLSTGRTRTIGIVFPLQVSEVVMHPVYPELLGALGDAAQTSGYDIMMFTVSSPQQIEHVVDAVDGKRVDGVVLPAAGSRDPLVRRLTEHDVPTVLIGHRTRDTSLAWVDCTHDEAAAQLTHEMLHNGRRRLVMLNGPAHVSACRLRSQGFWTAIESVGPGVACDEIAIEMDAAAGRATAMRLLSGADAPDGIVCASDAIASGVLEAAREYRIDVPGRLEVSGFDDSSFAIHTTPQLTTVRMPLIETGAAAMRLLIAMIDGTEGLERHIVLPTTIVHRESTQPVT
jgi:LacI family transcriptional regulator